jgi:hypothetical protein
MIFNDLILHFQNQVLNHILFDIVFLFLYKYTIHLLFICEFLWLIVL